MALCLSPLEPRLSEVADKNHFVAKLTVAARHFQENYENFKVWLAEK